MLSDYFPLLIFLAAVFVFGLIALFFPPWLAGHRDSAAKDLPYESGIVPRSGARRKFAVSFYLTAMLLNNPVDDRQPQSCPIVFCREKWIENMRQIFPADSVAVIADRDAKNLVRLTV